MRYFSTRQIAELWGISPRRVTLLAVQGRIEGARQQDGRWLIPEDAPKPEDKRRRESKALAAGEEKYIFPFVLAVVHSEEQIERFTPEEAELYRLCTVYETGDFARARQIAEKLLSSRNRYIRIGALYHLPVICMYLFDFEATQKYFILFRSAILETREHKAELKLINDALDSELVSISAYQISTDLASLNAYPEELIPLVSTNKLFSEVTKFSKGGPMPDGSYYELACRLIESQGYYFCAICMHTCMTLYYAILGASEEERFHMRRAIDIGLAHGTVFSLFFSLSCDLDTTISVLSEYDAELTERFGNMAAAFLNARNAYAEYQGIKGALKRLTDADYRLITYCLKAYSVEHMAELCGLSKSGMNRRLAKLYKKLGVKSKNEMVSVFLSSALEWENDNSNTQEKKNGL